MADPQKKMADKAREIKKDPADEYRDTVKEVPEKSIPYVDDFAKAVKKICNDVIYSLSGKDTESDKPQQNPPPKPNDKDKPQSFAPPPDH